MAEFASATAFVGVCFAALGYLIKFHGMVEMVAGYDPAKVVDRQGLANWIGGNFFLIALVSFVTAGIGFLARGLNVVLLIGVHVAVLLALIGRIVLGTSRYEKQAEKS